MVDIANAIEHGEGTCFKRKHENPLQKDNNNADVLELTFYIEAYCDLHISSNLKMLSV